MSVTSRQFCIRALGLLLLNLAISAAYRGVFIKLFAGPGVPGGTPAALLRGLRLDASLLALEVGFLALLALVTRRLRLRATLACLWIFTFANALCAAFNLLVFRERNRHLWEIVQDSMGQPHAMLIETGAAVIAHPLVLTGGLLGIALVALAASRHSRPLAGHAVDLWGPAACAATLAVIGACLLVTIEIVPTKEGKALQLRVVSSLDRMRLGNYALNQAVGNPLQDLIRLFDLPAGTNHYKLEAQEALALSRSLLELPAGDSRFPLLRQVRGEDHLGVRNVVVIMVEGLTASLIDHRVDGAYVMPYVHGLCERGLCFRKIIQSFSVTDGSVFSIVTSLPPPLELGRSSGRRTRDLPAQELNGFDGSLARSIGAAGYRHYYVAGFRQRSADFVTFMGNQGYRGFGYEELRARLGSRAREDSNVLGIFDGPMMREAAKIIMPGSGPFTAYLMTATTHTPWSAPPAMTNRVADEMLATFQYLDRSVRDFVDILRLHDPDLDHTLLVITGDHTSHVFDRRSMERLRVPLILFSARLARERDRWASRQERAGSHVDIVPTVLGLLAGEHPYSGMGRSLLGPDAGERGFISGTYGSFLYIKDGFALRYTLGTGASQLFTSGDADVLLRDVSDEQPDRRARLTRELLALSETAHRLGRDRRIFPLQGSTVPPEGR